MVRGKAMTKHAGQMDARIAAAFTDKTGAEAAATQAKSNVCAGERTVLLPTAG
jgi:hypothetical protein